MNKNFFSNTSDEFKLLITNCLTNFKDKQIDLTTIIYGMLNVEETYSYKIIKEIVSESDFIKLQDEYYSLSNQTKNNKKNKVKESDDVNDFSSEVSDIITQLTNSNDIINTANFLVLILETYPNIILSRILRKYNVVGDTIEESLFGKMLEIKQTTQKPLKQKQHEQLSNKIENDFLTMATVNIDIKYKNINANIVGRKKELKVLKEVLSKNIKHNAVLVGESGVGKTEIVKMLNNEIKNGNVPKDLINKEILILNPTVIFENVMFKNMAEERLRSIFSDLTKKKKYILLIENIHELLVGETNLSLAIGRILEDYEGRIIATTIPSFFKTISESHLLNKNLHKISVESMTPEETMEVLKSKIEQMIEKYGTDVDEKNLKKCIDFTSHYINKNGLPGKAIETLDYMCLKANLKHYKLDKEKILNDQIIEKQSEMDSLLKELKINELNEKRKQLQSLKIELADYKREKNKTQIINYATEDELKEAVSSITNIKIENLTMNDKKHIITMEDRLKEIIIGQDEAINKMCKIIKRNKVGLGNKSKSIGTALFVGASGVGKTLLAKKIALEIFGDENSIVRLDMSEYSEKHSVAKLIGAPPGYIGNDNGGQLTEAIKRKKNCVLLLDEIEKAHKDVYNMFLQVFDEGRLTDSNGNLVDFRNVIIILTSNVGTKMASELGVSIGFGQTENKEEKTHSIIEKEMKKQFQPEFLNRMDEIIFFKNLTEDNLVNITKVELKKLKERINNIGYDITYNENVPKTIITDCLDTMEYGARPINRFIEDKIENKIADLLLTNDYNENYNFKVDENLEIN